MEFRPGTCSACKATFRIPATFTANKAKCSKCGGAVDIGPVTSDNSPAAKPAEPKLPAKAAAAPVAGAAARLAAKPESTPTPAAKPVPARAVPASVPATPTAQRPIATAASSAPTKPMGKPAAEKPAAKSATKPTAKAAADSGSAKSRAKQSEADLEAEEAHASRRARIAKNKKMNPLLPIGALVALGVIGAGVWMMYKDESAAKLADQARVETERVAKAEAALIEKARLEQEELVATQQREEKAAAKATAAAEAKAAETAKSIGEAEAAKAARAAKPVEGFDVSTIPDFEPFPGTTPEQWTELQALAALFVDYSAGARASRAGLTMEKTPKQSFPAILNQFKRLNLEDETGFRMADATQKMLERICKGSNFGWKYQQDEHWLQYDQKAIKSWCDAWRKASTDEAYWKKLSKETGGEEDAPAEGDAPKPAKKNDDF